MLEQKIIDLVQQKCTEPLFQSCFLIEVHIKGKLLEVIMDADTGIKLEECQQISRYLEHHIDTNGWLGEDYTLEVSSPGIERPLKFARQYPRNIGRTLEVKLSTENMVKVGVLLSANAEQIILEETISRKEGRKKITEKVAIPIAFKDIQKAVVQLIF